jgi:hypothetical protein
MNTTNDATNDPTNDRSDRLEEQARELARVRAERRAYIRPLFDYCETHGMICLRVMRGPWRREARHSLRRQHLWRVKTGYSPAPEWFIAEVCREIGQPIEVVMGAEWAQRHLSAPTPELPLHGRNDGGQDDAQDDTQDDAQDDAQDDTQVGQRRAS